MQAVVEMFDLDSYFDAVPVSLFGYEATDVLLQEKLNPLMPNRWSFLWGSMYWINFTFLATED